MKFFTLVLRIVFRRYWGGLSKNGIHRLICLNTQFPVGRTVWEGLKGGVALLMKMCYWKWALKFQKPIPFSVHFPPQPPTLCLRINCKHLATVQAPCLSGCFSMLSSMIVMDSNHVGLWTPKLNTFFYKLTWSWCFVIE